MYLQGRRWESWRSVGSEGDFVPHHTCVGRRLYFLTPGAHVARRRCIRGLDYVLLKMYLYFPSRGGTRGEKPRCTGKNKESECPRDTCVSHASIRRALPASMSISRRVLVRNVCSGSWFPRSKSSISFFIKGVWWTHDCRCEELLGSYRCQHAVAKGRCFSSRVFYSVE